MEQYSCPGDAGHVKIEAQEPKTGYLCIPEAPVYYPTMEEFKDPYAYIEKIRHEAEAYGICRIVPPEQWKPPFAINRKTFMFPTKLQAIHHLQMRPAARDADTFKLEYTRFLEKEGRRVGSWPSFRGKELDLCQFFGAVKRHGGYQKVSKEKKWGDVLQILDPACMLTAHSVSLQSSLRDLYETHLYDYEVYLGKSMGNKRHRNMSDQEVKNILGGQRKSRKVSANEDQKVVLATDKKADQICEQCQGGAHEESMLLCDRCDRGWHTYCLTPPLSAVPSGNWYCFDCLTSEKESFGFTTGQFHNFDSFRQAAKRFKKKWFGGRKDVTAAEIEEEFWSVVERLKGPVEVLYGSDLASEVYGSGFPRSSDEIPFMADRAPWKEYAASPWNLNNITKLEGSVLKHVEENIPGVTVPWVYMGMLFSSFCWHYEDQCFYSINYLHWGEPKRWYGVPGSAIDAFEQVMHKTFPDLFEAQPDLLFQLVTMLNPRVLRENDVPVCTTLQERGNFVITFPRSYHGGFNHGLNCAEAVNFATLDWLPFGRFGVERARLYHKAAVLSQEELLCVVAKNVHSFPGSPSWLKKELKHMVSLERKQRMQLWKKGIIRSSRMSPRKEPNVIGTEEDPECVICRYYLFMSALTCSCCPGRVVCLQHCEQLCECSKDQQQLLYRYSLGELDQLQMESGCLDSTDAAVGELKEKHRRGRLSNVELGLRKEKDNKEYHMNLANAWCLKAKSLLQRTPKLLDVETLIREAEQFLWAGHEMDHVREIEKNLRYAQGWAQGVVTCLASSGVKLEDEHRKSEKPLLATAQQLLSVKPAPCDLEHSVSKLKVLVSGAVEMQHQLQALFCRTDPLELGELEGLEQKLLQSTFRFPELDQLDELVRSVHVWRVEVQTLLSMPHVHHVGGQNECMDMNKLHKLQAEASQMAVVLPEKKDLDVYVSKLEKWQDEAKLILESAVHLQDVEEILLEIENVPVYLHEAEVLEQRVHETQEWIRSSYRVIAAVQQQSYHTASKELLSSLLRSGELLRIKMKEIDYVKLELQRVSWLERATKGLQSQLTSAELIDFLEEASSLSLQNEELYIELHQVVEEARAWESRASQFLQDGATLDDFKTLRRDSGKIYASLVGWVGINVAITQAEAFLHHAQPFVKQYQQHTNAVLNFELLQELINQSESFKVVLPERGVLLDIRKGVSSWVEKAVIMITQGTQDLYESNLMSLLSMEMVAEDVKSRTTSAMNALLTNLRKTLDEGKALGFELPELDTLSTLVKATEWSVRVSHMLLDHPSFEELDLLVQEAKDFEGYFGELHQLRTGIRNGQEWIVKLRSVLRPQQAPPQSKCSVYEMEELLSEAKALGLAVFKDVSYLEQRVDFHKAWQKHMFRCLHPPKQAISWEELQQLQEIEKSSPIQFETSEVLQSESLKVGLWLSKCSTKLLGWSDPSSTPMMTVLSQVQTSVEGALQRLQRRAYIEGEDFHMGERMCHLCRRHVDYMSTNLLRCENCHDRYHRSCLGLEPHQEWTQNQFVCSFCNAFMAGVLWVDEDVLSKICVTKRPTLSALEELCEAADSFQFRLKEVELLERIIEKVNSWESCLEKLVEPILLSHWDQSYSSSLLLSALKIAGTMEVQGDGKGQLALALSVNSWRMHAKSVMESPTKPSYRTVCRILNEGLAIPFLAHDRVLKELKAWETMASVWLSQAKLVMEDNGTIPVEDVHKLILEGDKLPVAFCKEIADLSSRTVLYCICRKPYDKERAMIACDSCSEWYHFDCMNLPEPDSSDEDSSEVLHKYGSTTGEFFCPSCKGTEIGETRNLITQLEVEASDALPGDLTLNGTNCRVNEPLYNPLLWYSRGKRSRKASVKVRADLQGRWQSHNSLFFCSSDVAKEADCGSQAAVSASGRPCRRTAGHNSRFESFVLLMDSG